MAVDLRRSRWGALVPEPACALTGVPGAGGAAGVSGTSACDPCSRLDALLALLGHTFAVGTRGDNRAVILSNADPIEVAFTNPGRVALGITIPAGALVYHGFTSQVTPAAGGGQPGTPIPSGASWLFGPEWTGALWVVSAGPYPAAGIDVRIIEISA